MNFYFIFTKRGLAVILASLVLALVVIAQFSSVSRGYADGSTHRKRMEYLALYKLGVLEEAVSVKETRLPDEISGAAKTYNDIIKKSGFELSNFCSKPVMIYSYKLTDFPEKTVNLIIFSGKIIAGDITDNLKGTISPLIKEK